MKFEREKLTERINIFIGRYFIWCAGAVILSVFALGWLLLLGREYRSISDSGVLGYEQSVERLQERQEYLFDLQSMEEELKSINQERLVQLNEVLPVGFEPTEAMNNIQALAEASNLSILSMEISTPNSEAVEQAEAATTGASVQKRVSSDRVKTAVVTLNVESQDANDYQDLKRFLDVLQSYVPLFNMQTLNYSPDTTSFALQLVTYYLEESNL